MKGPLIWMEQAGERIAITQPAFAALSSLPGDVRDQLFRRMADISGLVKLTPARWQCGGENVLSARVSGCEVRYRVLEESLGLVVEQISTERRANAG